MLTMHGLLGSQELGMNYVLFTHASDKEIRTSSYHTVGAKTIKEGREISLSDHMCAEADLIVTEAV